MLHRATQVGVDDQGGITALRANEREIRDGGRFAFTRTTTDERDSVCFRIGAIEFDICPQNSIRFGVRCIAFGLVKQGDVLRNNRENRNTEETFDVVHRFHAGVEILDEKCETNADDEANEHSKSQIQTDSWARRITWRLGDLFHADGETRHGHLHGLSLGAGADAIEQRSLFDVSVLRARVVRAQIFCVQLFSVDLLQPLVQFIASALRCPQISFQSFTNNSDLLLELTGVNLAGGAERFDLRMIFAEAGIQEQRFLRDCLLIVGENFLHGWILNIESRQHSHQIIALEVLDLRQPARKRRDLGLGVVHFLLLSEDDVVDRRLSVFGSFGVKIDNVFLVPDLRHFRARFFDALLLFADFLVHHGDRAIENFFFFLDASVLIDAHDLVGDVGRDLRIGIKNADLKQVGIADFIDIELAAQHLIGALARRSSPISRPFLLKIQLLDDRIENAGALNDLINRGSQLRIVNWQVRVALTKNARIFCGRFNFNDNVGSVFPGLEISENRGGDQDQKECEQNEHPTDANYAPVIEKMKLNFFVVCHNQWDPWQEPPILAKSPPK